MDFFPADRDVPQTLNTPELVLRQLEPAQAALDYEAYMASPDVIRRHSGGRWPVDGFTLDGDREQLALHEARHHARQDFAFILLTPDQTLGLGCVYILPLLPFLGRAGASTALLAQATQASAMISFWLRQDRLHTRLAQQVIAAVRDWLLREWPFDDHLFRVNHEERESIQALEQSGLRLRFELALDKPPYRYSFCGKATD